MIWCLKCQAENANEATTCAACNEPFPAPLTGWRYIFYLLFVVGLVVAGYLLLRYLKAEGHIKGWLADQI